MRDAANIVKIFFCLFLCSTSICFAESSPDWVKIAPDLEYTSLSVTQYLLRSTHLEFFRTSGKSLSLQVVRAQEYGLKRSDTKTLCELSKGVFCINASFFDEQSKPLGLIIQNGILIQKPQKGGDTLTAMLVATTKGFSIVHRNDFSFGRILNAIQAGPRLISDAAPVPGLREPSYPSRRSGACIDTRGNLIFFTLQSSLFGMSVSDLQQTLLGPSIQCKYAINLDGGSSTQYYFSGSDLQEPLELEGEDKIPVVLSLKTISQ